MSLINRMLLDLDKRGGAPAGAMPRPAGAGPELASRIGSEWFWRILAALMFVAVAWVSWLIWELRPRPVVTELAMRAPLSRTPLPRVDQDAAADAGRAAATDPVRADPPDAQAGPVTVRAGGLRLAMELSSTRSGGAARLPETAPAREPRPVPAAGGSLPKSPAPAALPPVQSPAPKPVASQVSAPPVAIVPIGEFGVPPLRIEKRDTSTPRDRADAEVRRAQALRAQRRTDESLEAMRMALAIEPGHEGARLGLAASLVEARQYDEAVQALNAGLALNPGSASLAMMLARIAVERGDAAGALRILDRLSATAGGNAEYRAFRAALQQRTGRHADAVEEYRAALAISPGSGQWWIGLGISQQALAQNRDALESFRRARAAGNLTPELAGFADQRIRQLQ